MTRRIDRIGHRFGHLTVVGLDGKDRWICRCDCGGTKTVSGKNLRRTQEASCGCVWKAGISARSARHGKWKSQVHRAWRNMRHRCQNHRAQQWPNYGGRGISVCERWQAFENFYADMGDPPAGTSLDRIDVDGNYEPGNCRWATATDQQRNLRCSVRVDFGGLSKTLPEWAEEVGISSDAMLQRYKRGDRPPYLFRPAGMRV